MFGIMSKYPSSRQTRIFFRCLTRHYFLSLRDIYYVFLELTTYYISASSIAMNHILIDFELLALIYLYTLPVIIVCDCYHSLRLNFE